MPQFISFSLQVFFVVRIRFYFNVNIFHNFQSITQQTGTFAWIITHQFHFTNTQMT